MGKKNLKNNTNNAEEFNAAPKQVGGVQFHSSEQVLTAAAKQVGLPHVMSKPWTRDAWERAKPWILEQRQKLEDMHWSQTDHLRTELFELRKAAPSSVDTEDGYLHFALPRKWIDMIRAGKTEEERAAEELARGHTHQRVQHRRHQPSYAVAGDMWTVRVEQSDEHPSTVLLDIEEPLETVCYLLMTIAPGMARLHAQRDNVIQPGTKQVDIQEGEVPTMRIRAMVADSESYVRLLPPAYWVKRNATQLIKILGEREYAATLVAAEDEQRATQRTVTNCIERAWEEALPVDPKKPKKKSKKNRRPSVAAQQENALPAVAAA